MRHNITSAFATSFRRTFYAYHQAMKRHYTNIIISLFSIPFVLKCAAKCLKSVYKFSAWDFAEAREVIRKSLTLDSGKVVVFIQTFDKVDKVFDFFFRENSEGFVETYFSHFVFVTCM